MDPKGRTPHFRRLACKDGGDVQGGVKVVKMTLWTILVFAKTKWNSRPVRSICVHESGWASWRRKIGKTAAGKRRCCCTDVNVYVMYNLSHIKTERTYKPGNEDSSESSKIAAQDCDRWAPENFHPGVLGDHAEVLTMSEPTDVDSIRDLARVEFCTHLWQPRQTLYLLDALAGIGFVGEACVIEHDPETPRLVFDNHKPMSKRAYFRCVTAASGFFCTWRDNASNATFRPAFYQTTASRWDYEASAGIGHGQQLWRTGFEQECPFCGSLEEAYVTPNQLSLLASWRVGGDPRGGCSRWRVPMAEPAGDLPSVVADEVEADGAAWPEILEGVRFLNRKGKHDSGWSYFDRIAVS